MSNDELRKQVENASPHELVTMLYDKAVELCNGVLLRWDSPEEEDGGRLERCAEIIDELDRAIDANAPHRISNNLRTLYGDIRQGLMSGMMRGKRNSLVRARDSIAALRDAWKNAVNDTRSMEPEA